MVKKVYGLLMVLFMVSFISAINCNPSSIITNYSLGDSKIITTSCTNNGNSTSVTISGESSLISGSPTTLINGVNNLNLILSSSATKGIHSVTLNFGDGTNLPILFTVEEKVQTGCILDLFPTVLNNVKIVQGEKKTRSIQLTVPSCYNSYVDIRGVALQTDSKPIQLGELSLGVKQPGGSLIIPLEFDANGVSSGSYSDLLQFQLYDKDGKKINVGDVSISVLITQGIQSVNNFSLNDLPTCSLSAIEMSLNNSQKMTCSFTNPNIEIHPLIDSKYLKGLSVTETSNQYIYEFQPILIGQTSIGAEFLYKNAPLGSPFVQDIRISPSGNTPVSGITTKFNFYQNQEKKEIENLLSGETTIQITDLNTGNILTNYQLYINGLPANNTLILQPDRKYEVRSSVPGYLDNIINFTVMNVPLQITLNPNKEFYIINEQLNVSSTANETIYLLDNILITFPYNLDKEGIFLLKATKEGYLDFYKNITVKNMANIKSLNINFEDWKKGKNIIIELNKNTSWSILFEEQFKENGNKLYKAQTNLISGEGNLIKFKIEKYGVYYIKDGEQIISQKLVDNSNYLGFLPKWDWWIYGIIGVIVFFGGYWLIRDPEEDIGD